MKLFKLQKYNWALTGFGGNEKKKKIKFSLNYFSFQ